MRAAGCRCGRRGWSWAGRALGRGCLGHQLGDGPAERPETQTAFRGRAENRAEVRLIGQRGVVQHDAHRTVSVFLVTKAVVDLGEVAVFVCQLDPAHPHADIAFNEVRRAFVIERAPTLDAKTTVQRIVFVMAVELGQGPRFGWSY